MKNRKLIITAFLVIACMAIGIGYAAVTDNFVINGQATISDQGASDAFNEDIRFEGIVVDGNVQPDVLASANLGYTASCNVPLDQASFHITSFKGKDDTKTIVFRVKNFGDVDSVLKPVAETATNSNSTVFNVTYTLDNGTTAFPDEGTALDAGQTVDIHVTVTVANSVTQETTADFVFKFVAENAA